MSFNSAVQVQEYFRRQGLEELDGELQAQYGIEIHISPLSAEVNYIIHLQMHAQSSLSQNRALPKFITVNVCVK